MSIYRFIFFISFCLCVNTAIANENKVLSSLLTLPSGELYWLKPEKSLTDAEKAEFAKQFAISEAVLMHLSATVREQSLLFGSAHEVLKGLVDNYQALLTELNNLSVNEEHAGLLANLKELVLKGEFSQADNAAASAKNVFFAPLTQGYLALLRFDYAGAVTHFEAALALVDSSQVLLRSRYLNLAGKTLLLVGNFERAKPFIEQALALQEEKAPDNFLGIAETLRNLAAIETEMNQADTARQLYEEAFQVYRKAGKAHYEEGLKVLISHAMVDYVIGNPERFPLLMPQLESVLSSWENYNPKHPLIAVILKILANAYILNKNVVQGIAVYERLLKFQEEMYGKEHPQVLMTVENLGNLQAENKQAEIAVGYLKRAVAMREAFLGKDSPTLVLLWRKLGKLSLDVLAQPAEAKSYYEQALAVEVQREAESVAVTELMNFIALSEIALKDYVKAEATLNNALVLNKKLFGDKHIQTAVTVSHFGNLYMAQEQYEKAEAQFTDALERVKDVELGVMDKVLLQQIKDAYALLKKKLPAKEVTTVETTDK